MGASECKKVEVVPAKVGPLPAHAAPEQGELHAEAHRDRDGPEDLHQQAADEVCGSQGSPKGIMQQREVELFCLPKDREGMTMRQMAESGDKIERASSYPTESVAIVYEPEMC